MDKSNVRNVYLRLRHEILNVEYLKRIKKQDTEPYDIYLICDQIKDVFEMLQNRDDLYEFFDILDECDHIKLIATSLPNAYEQFLARWGDRPNLLPKEIDAAEDEIINIPLISEDQQRDNIQNWINFCLGVDSRVESIGDCIVGLNDYKENIVDGLYEQYNNHELPYLKVFLSSIQTVETFRRDAHLFLPILLFKNEITKRYELSETEAIQKTIETINYLIDNNVIWAADFRDDDNAEVVRVITTDDFDLYPEKSEIDSSDFLCDDELFINTKISTKIIYGLNEIIWEHLKRVDANRHVFLFDYNNSRAVEQSAQLYYSAVSRPSTLRRILIRVPRTEYYQDTSRRLRTFVFNILCGMNNPDTGDIEELNQVVSMLIKYSVGIDEIDDVLKLIKEKGITPNYSIIGQLYHVGSDESKDIDGGEIEKRVKEIRNNNKLTENTLFSFSREAKFKKLSFNDIIQLIKSTQFVNRNGNVSSLIDYAASCQNDKLVSSAFDRTFGLFAKMASNLDEWNQLLDLYVSCDLKMTRPAIFAFFTIMTKASTEFSTRFQHLLSFLPQDRLEAIKDMIPEDVVTKDIGKYSGLIKDEDHEYLFFSSIECSDNYTQAKKFFDMYIKFVDKENPRMASIVLHQVKNSDFQNALLFLQDLQQRYSDDNKPFSSIIYNNLLKRAPNVGEALAVLPNISNIQDFTLSNILLVLKNRKISNAFDEDELLVESKTDPKLFFYAYNVIMRKVFKNHRKVPSPFVLGILFNFVSTRKQEDFIRNKYLQVDNREKIQLIDLSTTIASIRIKKNYRSIGKPSDNNEKIDSSWSVFNKCRSFYNAKKWYINSDLYSNMMRKIVFTFKDDKENFSIHMKALRDIIDQDDKRIIKDDYFLPNRYAYDPIWNQAIFDGDKVSEVFREQIMHSKILRVKALNKVLMSLDSAENVTFKKVWTFYQFMKDHYTINRRWRTLKPDNYTFTQLLKAVQTQDDYDKVINELKDLYLYNNGEGFKAKKYLDSLRDARKRVGLEVDNPESPKKRKHVGDIIEQMKGSFDENDIITPTILNNYLKRISDLIDKVKDVKIKAETKQYYYDRLSNDILDPYYEKLYYDVSTCVSMMKLSPKYSDAQLWIDYMFDTFSQEDYCYNMTSCRELAISTLISRYNIENSVAFFDYWKKIMDDIGYEPGDSDSFTEDSDKPKKSQFKDDYDYYWSTRWEHLSREMHNYCATGRRDNERLKSIKEQIQVFDDKGEELPVFKFMTKQHNEVVDFRAIIREKLK